MKGLELERKVFDAIVRDHKWQDLLVFDNDRNVFIDLGKYSALGHYLPIESEFQAYMVGYKFVQDLYACVYRTQNDLVCIYPKLEPEPKLIRVLKPVFEPIKPLDEQDSGASSVCEYRYIKEWKFNTTNQTRGRKSQAH